ncbi:hypothetical protein [Aequorivita marina]|uniref:hypothetical protein n=1 Tax=Aequorivita marina TaxID=3073654 RepID=UPI002875176A|nr:hypothetical protein [Aequorivita sp. S2608]MDS1297558.1 hypothetical protein [Aequorivita sp. S2608]
MAEALLINLFELLAFIFGLFYYSKNKSKPTYYLVWFLGITIFIELFNWYAYFVYFGYFSFLKGTVFESNYWSGNIYGLISYLFYINYFKWHLLDKVKIKIVNAFAITFLVVSLAEIVFSGGFFLRLLPISNVLGTILVLISISFYYLELLKSNQILVVQRSLPFYVSVGALLYHLCATPLFIYSVYYSNSVDPGFVSLYRHIIFGINILFYSIYIVGFLICSQSKTPYLTKKNF